MRIILVSTLYLLLAQSAALAQNTPEELRKIARNPFADEIKLSFEEDVTFSLGPYDRTANSLQIKPEFPISITKDWLLVTRVIATALAYQPDSAAKRGGTTGLGDTTASFFPDSGPYWTSYLGVGADSLNPVSYKRPVGLREMGVGYLVCRTGATRMGDCGTASSEHLVNCRRLEPFPSEPAPAGTDVLLQSASRVVPDQPADDYCKLGAADE